MTARPHPDAAPTSAASATASGAAPFVAYVGQLIGRYRLTGALGVGGMGTVYSAEDTLLGRPVALKVLTTSTDPKTVKRFVSEARAAARLTHPNVAAVYDIGEHGAVRFIAMELVPGLSAQQRLRAGGPMDWRSAARVAADACRALSAAHAAGIVHRDIKPGNVMCQPDGSAKLLDFGIAKLSGPGGPGSITGSSTDNAGPLTQAGSVMGTAEYMSPEQCEGGALDGRSDLYSLGCTLFQLLAGRTPFGGEGVGTVQLIYAHLYKPAPDVRELAPDVPAALSEVIRKAMAKKAADRFQKADEMLAALTAVMNAAAEPPAVPAQPPTAAPAASSAAPKARDDSGARPVAGDPIRPASPASESDTSVRPLPERFARLETQLTAEVERLAQIVSPKGPASGDNSRGVGFPAHASPRSDGEGSGAVGGGTGNGAGSGSPDGLPASPAVLPEEQERLDRAAERERRVAGHRRSLDAARAALAVGRFEEAERHALEAGTLLPDDTAAVKLIDEVRRRREESTREIAGPAGIRLVRIRAGSFVMGSPPTEPERSDDEGPQRTVSLSRDFHISAHLVTVRQFREFVSATGYRTEAETDGAGALGWNGRELKREPRFNWRNPGFPQTDAHPVTCVSWNDAVRFCRWLGEQANGAGKVFRLPTEAEWEYACRAGTSTRFWTGEPEDSLRGAANIADASFRRVVPSAGWAKAWDDGHPFTSPVGKFRPNAWGLFDTHGNVWEWCADWYAKGCYSAGENTDPQGPAKGTARVVRGGSWYYNPRCCRSAFRESRSPSERGNDLGFRVVMVLAG